LSNAGSKVGETKGSGAQSSIAKTITWVLFVVWIAAFVGFLAKFLNFAHHPVSQSGNGGGPFLAISQLALGAAVILIWQSRGKEA